MRRVLGSAFVASAFLALGAAGCSSHAGAGSVVPQSAAREPLSAGGFRYTVEPKFTPVAPGTQPLLTFSQCTSTGSSCFSPTSIKSGYNIPATGGAGATIVIIDAYINPTVQSDLNAFAKAVGLPNKTITITHVGGTPTFDPTKPDQVNFAAEQDLDVQWAYAMAPQANIVLLTAPNSNGDSINKALTYAIATYANAYTVLSQSFGVPESIIGGNNVQLQQAHALYVQAANAGMSVLSASGDGGATAGLGSNQAYYPASDPYVTAVGGTDLKLFNNGSYRSERVWNDFDAPTNKCSAPHGATGGAPSTIFSFAPGTPNFQSGVHPGSSARWTSDVAFNASACTGIEVYLGFPGVQPGLYAIGGTSQAVPQWAGIIALANGQAASAGKPPLGYLNNRLYDPALVAAGAYHDITSGDNFNPTGFAAAPGWDPPTGWGTPSVAQFLTTVNTLPVGTLPAP